MHGVLTSFREVEEELDKSCLSWTQKDWMRFSIIELSNWDRAFRDFQQDLESLIGDWTICDGDLAAIDLVDDELFNFLFDLDAGIFLRFAISVLRVKESLGNEDIFLEVAFTLSNFFLE